MASDSGCAPDGRELLQGPCHTVGPMTVKPDADHVVLTLARGDKGELRISRSSYGGKVFTKLHLWYPAGDDLRPGRQVVTIRDHELADVIEVLRRIAERVGQGAQQPTARRAPSQGMTGPTGAQPVKPWCSPDEGSLF